MPVKFIERKTLVQKACDGTYSGRRCTPKDVALKDNLLDAYVKEFNLEMTEISVQTYIKFDKVRE